jgi:hypothetical protein
LDARYDLALYARYDLAGEGASLREKGRYRAKKISCEVERCDNEMEIPDFTFAADQMTFIVGCKDHTATLYDTASMEPVKKYLSDRYCALGFRVSVLGFTFYS